MKRVLGGAALALLLFGCGADRPVTGQAKTAPAPAPVVPPVEVAGSVFDAVKASVDGDYEGSRRDLADLLVPPAALACKYRLAALEVDDPNGNGKVDGHWYPPRILSGNCRINVDMAPVPTASAAYVPGNPDKRLTDDDFGSARAALEASYTMTSTLQFFDDSAQCDAPFETMIEFYGQLGSFGCEQQLKELAGSAEEIELPDIGYPGNAAEVDMRLRNTAIFQYRVGTRTLLTIALQPGIKGLSKAPASAEVDPFSAIQLIELQIAKLRSAGLG